MELFVGFVGGLLCLVAFGVGILLGVLCGAQSAVDQTLRQGFFKAYNKRYRAVEIIDNDTQEAR